MTDWKKNKVVGMAAGVIFVLAMAVLFKTMLVKPKPLPVSEGKYLIPVPVPGNLPYIKK